MGGTGVTGQLGTITRDDCSFFFFNDTSPPEFYTLSLHDALPIFAVGGDGRHAPVKIDGTGGQAGRNCRGQLLVPPNDVVALIGGAEDAEVARLRLKAEQIHQV